MANIYIYVSRIGNSRNIKLRDSENHNPGNDNITTGVRPGDTLIWALDTLSGLHSINGIRKKAGTTVDLLAGPAVRQADGTYHATVVARSPGAGKEESYEVGYQLPGDTTIIWDDPKIKINV